MYKKILLPIDGSEASDKAFEKGMKLAKSLGIPVVITNIVDQSFIEAIVSPVPGSPMEKAPAILESLKESSADLLSKKNSECKERGVPCEVIVKVGHPVHSILELVEETGADLIVMGSHGRGRITSVALGSVSYGVVHKAKDISVLVVR
jgi:nucleotide-binding universal stress UspA family protein